MFDKNEFVKRLGEYLLNSGRECLGVWMLAPNIFVAEVRKNSKGEWVNYFFYDTRDVHMRNVLDMATAKLQTAAINIDIISITGDDADKVRICFVTNEEPRFDAFSFAKNIFVANDKDNEIRWSLSPVDEQEIPWFACPISIRHY